MNRYYEDLLALTPAPPSWYDDNAVPRWCPFSPGALGVYDDEAALLRIACQDCRSQFDVAMASSLSQRILRVATVLGRYAPTYELLHDHKAALMEPPLARAIRAGAIHYGDPPNVCCCDAGPTMNSVPMLVVEYWSRRGLGDWARDAKLEGPVPCSWADAATGTDGAAGDGW